MMHGQKKHQIK